MRLLVLLLITTMVGCASVTGSSTQAIAVTTVCEGRLVKKSYCELSNDKGKWEITAPGSVEVQKSYEDLEIICKNESSTGAEKFRSRNNNNVWGNLLLGGVVGYAIDASGGAGFDYPKAVTIVLTPPCPQGVPP